MTRMSLNLVVVWCLFCPGSWAQDQKPTVMEVPAVMQAEVERRSLDDIRFEGNKTYSAQSIRRALENLNDIHQHLWPQQPSDEKWTGTSWDEFTTELSKQILAGYQQGGFLNAKVEVKTDDLPPLVVVIDEGPEFTAGATIIDGVTAEVEEAIRNRLSANDSMSAGVFKVAETGDKPKQIWQPNKKACISRQSRQQILDRVNGTLEDFGYNYAKSSIEFAVDQANSTVDLRITVDPSQQNPVRDLVISGLTSYSDAEVRQIINLKPGLPACPQLCRRIEAALVGSGRFLFAKADAGVPFVEGQSVDINVRVCEYSEVDSKEPLTKVQQGILRYAEWLSAWSEGNEDFVIDASFDVEKCHGKLPQGWQTQIESASKLVKAKLRNLKIHLVASPTDGVLLKVKAESTTGEVLIDHTLVNTQDLIAVVSHRNHRKWLIEGESASGVGTRVLRIGLHGLDTSVSKRRLNVLGGFNTKSDSTAPMTTQIDIQPTALLCSLTSRFLSPGEPRTTPAAAIVTNKDGREVVRCHGVLFAVETDLKSGEFLSASADHDGWRCVVKAQAGQLQKDVAQLLKKSQHDVNQYQVDHGAASVLQFLAAEIESQSSLRNVPMLKLAVKLLADPGIQSVTKDWLDPQSASENFPLQAPDSTANFLIWLTPQDQVLRQVIQVVSVVDAQENAAFLRSVTGAAVSREEFGPISCALLADRFRRLGITQFVRIMARLGQRRLTTESLVSELEAYLNPATLTGAFANGCVSELKKLNEEEVAALVTSMNPIKLKIGGRDFTIDQSMLNVVIPFVRNHQSSETSIVLQDCLALMCETRRGDLNDFFAALQQPVSEPKSFFRRASSAKDKSNSKAKSRTKRGTLFSPFPTPAADLEFGY